MAKYWAGNYWHDTYWKDGFWLGPDVPVEYAVYLEPPSSVFVPGDVLGRAAVFVPGDRAGKAKVFVAGETRSTVRP